MIDHPEPTREPGTRLDLAERLEGDAEVAARLHTTGSNRRAADLREAAEALRSAPPDSGARGECGDERHAMEPPCSCGCECNPFGPVPDCPVHEPAPTVREDDEADHSRSVGVTDCADADIDAVSNLVVAHGNPDHIAAMDRLIARAVPAPPDRVAEGRRAPYDKAYGEALGVEPAPTGVREDDEARVHAAADCVTTWAAAIGTDELIDAVQVLMEALEPAPTTLKGEDE